MRISKALNFFKKMVFERIDAFQRPRSKTALLLGLSFIVLWQSHLAYHPHQLTDRYRIKASTGLPPGSEKLFYFYYYLGLFPVVSENAPHAFSKADAEKHLLENKKNLLMDSGQMIRTGDYGKIFLFFPKAWLTGTAKEPSLKPFSAIFLIFSLMILFVAFWYHKMTLLGAFMIWALGANSMISFEAYGRANIFSYPASFAILLAGLHFPLLKNLRMSSRSAFLAAILTGTLVGFFKEVRTEIVLIAFSAIVLHALNKKLRFWLRGLTIFSLLASAYVSNQSFQSYFEKKFTQAKAKVTELGGHPYAGPRFKSHGFWHPVFCGLGDFDNKYGYKWKDKAAAEYATPVVRERFGIELPQMIDCCHSDEFYDEHKKYSKRPYEVDEYNLVIRDKVLSDITNDPLWYSLILIKRIAKILIQSTAFVPLLTFINLPIEIPTLFAMIFAYWLYRRKDFFYVRLILFPLPMAAVSLMIFAGRGTTYYIISNMMAVGIGLHLMYLNRKKIGDFFLQKWNKWQKRPEDP